MLNQVGIMIFIFDKCLLITLTFNQDIISSFNNLKSKIMTKFLKKKKL